MNCKPIYEDRVEGDIIYIHDNSGNEFKVLKTIIFISEDGEEKYRIQKSRIRQPRRRKYAMQK